MINTKDIAKEYRLSHWSQIMQERTASGMSIREYCSHIGIGENTYFYWQRRVRSAACELLVKAQNEQPPGFAKVRMLEAPVQRDSIEQAGSLQVEIAGIRLKTDHFYPTDKLASLLRELARS